MKKPIHPHHRPKPLARLTGLLLLALALATAFTGCGRGPDSEASDSVATTSENSREPGWFARLTGYPGKLANTRKELETARAAAAQAERDAQAMRVLLDTQRDATEQVGKSRSFWRVASTVLIALAIVAIFVGAAIGSFARHSHHQQLQRDAHTPHA